MNLFSELSNGGIGLTINYDGDDDIIDLPSRESLIELNSRTKLKSNILNKERLLFMPNDITEVNQFSSIPYYLRIFGILENGEKAEVRLTGIKIFFDIEVPNCIDGSKFQKHLQLEINTLLRPSEYKIETIYSKSMHKFLTSEREYKRIITNNTIMRNNLMKHIKENMAGINLYSNDERYHYRKVTRENKLCLTDWNTIENYSYEQSNEINHIFILDKDYYKKLEDIEIKKQPYVLKDRTVVASWDIETYSSKKTGEVPKAENETDSVFMICITFHWLHEELPLYNVCIVDVNTEPDPRWTTIVCNNQENIIKAMAICLNHFRPDIMIGFNDSGYDWPFVIEKVIQLNLAEWFWRKISLYIPDRLKSNEAIISTYYNNNKYRNAKISAEQTIYYKCPKISGCVCIDVSTCFLKLYPRKEEFNRINSLSYYLEDNNLPSKADLSIAELWRIYVSKDYVRMREIAYYCIIDCISSQRLMLKRSVISDYREMSLLAYVPLSDSHHYANGCKVTNLVAAYAFASNILVNMNRHFEKSEYPGAYVFPPAKGIIPDMDHLKQLQQAKTEEEINLAIEQFANDRPVTCVDFASLYPSLIMTYNFSPEKIITDENEKNALERAGHKFYEINFTTGSKHVKAWSAQHSNVEENLGLFPKILINLFNKRREMKLKLKELDDYKEIYSLIVDSTDRISKIDILKNKINEEINDLNNNITIPEGSSYEEELESRNRTIKSLKEQLNIISNINLNNLDKDYSDIIFERNYINNKQNALKVYMNTFYGEMGNVNSPMYLLELAGAVTSAGQRNIKLVADYVRNKGFGIKYGDSVMPYTPITLRTIDGCINIVCINHFDKHVWISCPEYTYCPGSDKEYFTPNYMKTWTDDGWSDVLRIIRHRTVKKIYRIFTNKGVVDVTEDHSLLDANRFKFKPEECNLGMELLHSVQECMMSYRPSRHEIKVKGQLQAQIDFQAIQRAGYNIIIDSYCKYTDIYTLLITDPSPDDNKIKNIEILYESYEGFVYDIETREGTFQAGIGNIIVKNTCVYGF
jgi:DNA polymerase elongation subunit (family B)